MTGWLPGVSLPLLFAAQFALAIAAGVVMAKAIEFPCLRLRDRLIPR
jgi:hypothetical protein